MVTLIHYSTFQNLIDFILVAVLYILMIRKCLIFDPVAMHIIIIIFQRIDGFKKNIVLMNKIICINV